MDESTYRMAPPQNNNALNLAEQINLYFSRFLKPFSPFAHQSSIITEQILPSPKQRWGAGIKTVSQPRNYFRRGIG